MSSRSFRLGARPGARGQGGSGSNAAVRLRSVGQGQGGPVLRTDTRSREGARPSAASGDLLGMVLGRVNLQAPARIMAPRVLVALLTLGLVGFGLVMVFSASSVKALSQTGDAWYYVTRQAINAGLGLFLAAVIMAVDYHVWCRRLLPFICALTLGALLVVEFFGTETNGATRWIAIGTFSLQPSEFAKVSLLMGTTYLANDYFGERSMGMGELLVKVLLYLAVPLGLIFFQPDKGTTGIIVIMLLAVLVTAGMPRSLAVKVVLAGAVAALVVTLKDSYARERLMQMINPWADQYEDGWQLTQGFIAFGSGGLFGRGVGMSVQKYSWLPESHNDFIFAIVGEELGLVGTVCLLAAFGLLFREMLKVAHDAPDREGRLFATGVVAILCAQLFLNVSGVLGIFPLSGKPLPFISYGGSSIMSCLMLVGCVLNVSLRSNLPETVHDVRRRQMTLSEEDTGVSEAHVHGGLRMVQGGAGRAEAARVPGARVPSAGGSARRPHDGCRAR